MASVGDELVLTPSKMTNSRFDDVKLDASGNALQPQASVDVAPALKDSAARIHHYAVLDTYRFLAASGVVFYHFENHFQTFLSISTNYLERFQNFVDFFFVLSGFVLMHSYGYRLSNWHNYRDFLRKRFARLYPLHLATLILMCALGLAVIVLHLQVKHPSSFDFSLVPTHLLLIQAWGVNDHPGLNSPSWSISAEMFVYLLFPLLALFLKRVGVIVAITAAAVFAGGIEGLRLFLGLGPGELATYDFGIFRALPAFLLGMATFAIVNSLPPKPFSWIVPNTLAIVVVILMLWQAPTYLIIALFPVLVGLIALAERGGKSTMLAAPVAVLLGNASYAIYMTHTFFQMASVSFARQLGWTSPLELCFVAIGFFFAIVGCGILSYLCFETPMRKLLLRRLISPSDTSTAHARVRFAVTPNSISREPAGPKAL